MPDAFRDVYPGEIISSDRFNEVLRELSTLRDRVAVLEAQPGGSLIQITGYVPSRNVGQQAGGELVIQGTGFETPAWNAARLILTNEITIGGIAVPPANFVLPRCTDQQLVVRIPTAVDDGTLGTGRDVPLRIVNRFGIAADNYRVLPSTATRPDPVIDPQTSIPPGIEGPAGDAQLDSGSAVVIHGANFSPTAGENTITIEITGGAPLTISGLTVNGAGTRIDFTMPTTLGTPTGATVPALLRLAVQGAAASATANVTLLQQ